MPGSCGLVPGFSWVKPRELFTGSASPCMFALRIMSRGACLVGVFLILIALASAQEINIAIGTGARPAPRTLFDEIEDQRERRAFRELWDAAPRDQINMGARFVETYPRSLVLREAYELTARAHVAAGDLPLGLVWARRSLRLLPENPFLLVMVADLSAKLGELDAAVESARDALRYLAQAEPPAQLAGPRWPLLRDEMRATALFVQGRVAAQREQHAQAEQSLLASLTLNPNDMEALYTIGVVRMAVRSDEGAARAFSRVVQAGGPLATAAQGLLRALYARGPQSGATFDEWQAALKWNPPEPAVAVNHAAKPARYAGSLVCRDCHAGVFASWQSTGMAKMFRDYRDADIIGDFSGAQIVGGHARAIREGGRHFIDVRRGDTNAWVRYPVDYVVGSKWQQAYATRLPDARLLVFPIQYSKLRSAWVNYWAIVDGPGSPRTDISQFHNAPANAVYQTTCAPCHTSQLSLPRGADQPAAATFREGGINCEMCHGPSLDHVERLKAGASSARNAATAPLSFRRMSPERYVAVCAQCHAQSAVHDAQPGGAVNYSESGEPYRGYSFELPSAFPRTALYRDGRYRATTFISEAFARTECFRKGNATCGSCHDPHPPNAAQNPNSLKFEADSDAMCVQCHTSIRKQPERHTRHAPDTEASRCVSCHMPRIMEAVLFQARSHEIDDIPDADMTERFGRTASPNACAACHADRDDMWLRRSLAAFKPAK
jgi:predicted CXXCH cytochrome family protein